MKGSTSMEGAVTGPRTVKFRARSEQGSGVGAGASDRMASKGTRILLVTYSVTVGRSISLVEKTGEDISEIKFTAW